MPRRVPNIFLSSTYYDLRHVRAELRRFVSDDLGYNLLSSETADFPVDPTADAVENCRRRVEADADIFVLVIGSRYGSISDEPNASITNVEYRVARAKAIPIFAFVHRDTLALLEAWRRNPAGNYEGLVDSPRLFEFIRVVREVDNVWTFPFDVASDIVESLRKQLAYIMSVGVQLHRQLAAEASEAVALKGESLRLVVDRPLGWSAQLFSALVREELTAASPLRIEHARGIALGASEVVLHEAVPRWMKAAIAEATRIIEAVRVAPEHINEAIQSGSIAQTRASARHLVSAYRGALEWAARLRRAYVPELWRDVFLEHSLWLDDILHQIEELPGEIDRQVAACVAASPSSPPSVVITLVLRLHNEDRIRAAMERVNDQLDVE